MKLKKNMLIIFTLGSLFYACKRVNCPQLETQYFYTRFSVGDTSFIPYNGKDTLWFRSENGNIMKLICNEKFTYGKETCVDWGTNPDCGSIWKCKVEDQYHFNFKMVDGQDDLKLVIGKINDFPNFLPDYSFVFKLKKVFEMNGLNIIKEFEKDSINFKGNYITGSLQDWDSVGLYDVNFGLLRFKDEKSIVWTLIEKK